MKSFFNPWLRFQLFKFFLIISELDYDWKDVEENILSMINHKYIAKIVSRTIFIFLSYSYLKGNDKSNESSITLFYMSDARLNCDCLLLTSLIYHFTPFIISRIHAIAVVIIQCNSNYNWIYCYVHLFCVGNLVMVWFIIAKITFTNNIVFGSMRVL